MSHGRAGFTLLELVVALTLVALLLAVALPMFRLPTADPATSRDALVRARRLALQRGEEIDLRVHTDGAWSIAAAREPGVALAQGTATPAPSAAMHVRVSAIGICRPIGRAVDTAGDAGAAWDAAGCEPAQAATTP